jgi:urease accessory protein UreF
MFEQATITMSMSAGWRCARASASRAAATQISACSDSSSLPRSAMRGAMRFGSRMPSLSITWRDLMPDAFSMKAADDGSSAATVPASMAAACSALNSAT